MQCIMGVSSLQTVAIAVEIPGYLQSPQYLLCQGRYVFKVSCSGTDGVCLQIPKQERVPQKRGLQMKPPSPPLLLKA